MSKIKRCRYIHKDEPTKKRLDVKKKCRAGFFNKLPNRKAAVYEADEEETRSLGPKIGNKK
jgi:hypothetical protein